MTHSNAHEQTILVVGGGISGMTAAVEAAELGYPVVLIEQSASLGGRVAQLNRYFPKLCHPACGLEINYQRIRKNSNIRVFTMAEMAEISGEAGNYTVTIKNRPRYVNANCTACGDCRSASKQTVANEHNQQLDEVTGAYLPHEMAFPMRYVIAPEIIGSEDAEKIKQACRYDAVNLDEQESQVELSVAAIIWATGWRPYDAAKIQPYGYGRIPNVINNIEMERLAAGNGPTQGKIQRPSDQQPAKKIALIQCAGSRDLNHLPYCSRICCLASLKHAAYIREQYADAQVDIYYIDIRAHDKLESFYKKIASDPQVHFIKSKPAGIEHGENDKPVVCGENTLTREIYRNPYDLVVLATGMEASTNGCTVPESIVRDDYGFIVPELQTDGIFPAGVAAGPFDVSMSVQAATAAALKAIQVAGTAQHHSAVKGA